MLSSHALSHPCDPMNVFSLVVEAIKRDPSTFLAYDQLRIGKKTRIRRARGGGY